MLARELGSHWRDSLIDFDPLPAAAASIGQVHQATWSDGPYGRGQGSIPGSRRGAALGSAADRTAFEGVRAARWRHGCKHRSWTSSPPGSPKSSTTPSRQPRSSRRRLASQEARSSTCRLVLASTPKVMVSEWVEGAPLSSAAHLPEKKRNASALQLRTFSFRRAERGWTAACRSPPRKLQAHEGRPARGRRLRAGCAAA